MPAKKSSPFSVQTLLHTPLKPKARRRLRIALDASGVAALLGVFLLVFGGALRAPEDPYTGEYITLYSRVSDFAEDYTTLWLAGSTQHTDSFKTMAAEFVPVELPDTAYTVNKVRAYVEDARADKAGADLFSIVARAQVVAPGGSGVEWLTFSFTIAGFEDTFQAVSLPAPVNTTRVPYVLTSGYENSAKVDSSLGASVSNFVSAYMVPSSTTASLASTVTQDFPGSPVSGSVWKQVEVIGISYSANDAVTPDSASNGNVLHALVTVRAVTSNSTWSIVQLPLVVQMQSNGQWSVASIEEFASIGSLDTGSVQGSQSGS